MNKKQTADLEWVILLLKELVTVAPTEREQKPLQIAIDKIENVISEK
jgi:hypothetical protein